MARYPRTAAEFGREGFAALPGFLSSEDVAAGRAAVEAAFSRPLPPGCERPHNTLIPLSWSDDLVQRTLRSPDRIARLAGTTEATDLRWISAYVSVKEPRSDPLWWHQDWWCWDNPVSLRPAAAQVAVLCYLSDTSASTAALRVLPGTHHRSIDLHADLPEAHAREAGELSLDDPAMRPHPDQVTLEARAGDAFVADYRLLHGTHANDADRRRDCLVLSFTPSWSDLPEDLRAHLIRHPAQPRRGVATGPAQLLPAFDGVPRDLPLSRAAPERFAVAP